MGPRKLFIIVTSLVLAAVLASPPVGARTDEGDAVAVLLFSIDALSPEQLDDTTEGGDPVAPFLRSLRDQGVVWTEARSVMASETLPNHVAMSTGTYAGSNGIPGNTGRVAPGDTTTSDPDLGIDGVREAISLVGEIEGTGGGTGQCPHLRTITAFSKDYVWRTHEDESDTDFEQPTFNIPGSGHAPDTSTTQFVLREQQDGFGDHVFVNFGDHDRTGHVDATGAVQDPTTGEAVDGPRVLQRAALAQVDTFVRTLVEQLQQADRWDRTVLIITSDHAMSWRPTVTVPTEPSPDDLPSSPEVPVALQSFAIDIDGALEQVEVDNGFDPGEVFLTSLNGGAAFVYLVDPAMAGRDQLLVEARTAIADLDGVDEALHRLPNPLEPGFDVEAVHPAWNVEGTDRVGEVLATAESRFAFGTADQNPIPGNHGHATMRRITAIVTGGWDGIDQPKVIEASDPSAVDVVDDTEALPEQVEQVDWAPTIGRLLGVQDPGLAAGGDAQWQGRALAEAFTRWPADPVCLSAASADDPGTGGDDGAPADPTDGAPDDDSADDGGSLPTTGGGLAGLAALLLAAGMLLGRGRGRDG